MQATIANLRAAVERAGGTLEEDHGSRDTRTFQLCAPDGKRWVDGVRDIRIEWAKRPAIPSAQRFNEGALAEAIARMSAGFEPIPAELADFYAED